MSSATIKIDNEEVLRVRLMGVIRPGQALQTFHEMLVTQFADQTLTARQFLFYWYLALSIGLPSGSIAKQYAHSMMFEDYLRALLGPDNPRFYGEIQDTLSEFALH